MCLVSLAGLRLTGTLLFVPQVRDKYGCHPVMSTEGEGDVYMFGQGWQLKPTVL